MILQDEDNIKTFIYELSDPRDGLVKYIGKADNPKDRLYKHMTPFALSSKSKKNSWLKSLKQKELKPILNIIDEISKSEWEFWERHYISLYKSWGFDLTNGTNGGDQGPIKFGKDNYMTTIEAKLKRSLAMRGSNNPQFGKTTSILQKESARGRKGKSYEEIYGKERAEEERRKRLNNRSRQILPPGLQGSIGSANEIRGTTQY